MTFEQVEQQRRVRQIENGSQRRAGSRSARVSRLRLARSARVSRPRRNDRPKVSPSRVARVPSTAGLTAVELLVATCLASLLMVTVLSVLASLRTKWDVLRDDPAERLVERRVASQLRWDLEHAQTLQWSPEEIRLSGFAGRSFDNGTVTHRPVEIVYAVRSGAERRWLVRQERQMDIRSRLGVDVQLVCGGVSGFEIGTLFENVPIAMEAQPVPDRLQVALHCGTDAKPMRFQLVLR